MREFNKNYAAINLMKKIPLILSALLIGSTPSYAGDAPKNLDAGGVTFNIGGKIMLEGIAIEGRCINQANAADVFANELTDTDAGTITADLVTLGFAAGSTLTDDPSYTFKPSPCGANDVHETFPKFEFSKELTFDVSAQLYNGLDITFRDTLNLADIDDEEDDFELSLGGAFGSIKIQDKTSAVDSMLVGTSGSKADTAITVTSDGHVTATSGNDAGIGITYFTPSFGGVGLAFGYNPNIDSSGLDTSEFRDTYSVGFGYETFIGDVVLSLGGGIEKAVSETDTPANCLTTDLSTAESATSSSEFFAGLYGSSRCGDETLSAIGADIGFGDYTLSSAFSNLDTTEGSDMSVWSLGIARTINQTDYTVGYTQETLSYARDKTSGTAVEDQSSILMLEATKPLGEGVDLGLNISNTDVDNASEELGNGPHDAWRAGVSVTLGF